MQLREFVKEVLVEIAGGAEDADKELGLGYVNPKPRGDNNLTTLADAGYIPSDQQSLIQQVKFDVAVTSSEGTETKGGLGIMIAPISVGTSGKSDHSESVVSRISFQVPLALARRTE